MGDDCVQQLLSDASVSPNIAHFDFSLWHNLPQRASSALSHKHNPKNTLVSMPRQVTADTFELHLMIDEDCELMNDHLSGQHVQGMVLIERSEERRVGKGGGARRSRDSMMEKGGDCSWK